MYFNSFNFLAFLPIVFAIYWIVNIWTKERAYLKLQNCILVLASYIFYGWWDWRFLALIAFSTILDFFVGLQIAKPQVLRPRKDSHVSIHLDTGKIWLSLSLVMNLGVLLYFKYANFFIDSWIIAWQHFGINMNISSLQLILPVGISFYTFQTLSYSIDVYRRKLTPTTDIIEFAAFVSFFPQLVAGPIERASSLLPQIQRRRVFNTHLALSGLNLILWGMFKKVVVADTCAIYADDIFNNYESYSGITLVLGAVYFSFQIYCDFSGYSDIAIGTARLFGVQLMKNFRTPYFSRDIAEFWRRWHISLSTWFRDYLYIPLGGSRAKKPVVIRNTFIIFLVSGFWHGANMTFIVWGFIHALLFLPLQLTGRNRKHVNTESVQMSISDIVGILATFSATTFAWIFFRSQSLTEAVSFCSRMLSLDSGPILWKKGLFLVVIFILLEILIDKFHGILTQNKTLTFVLSNILVIILLLLVHASESQSFIYFQF